MEFGKTHFFAVQTLKSVERQRRVRVLVAQVTSKFQKCIRRHWIRDSLWWVLSALLRGLNCLHENMISTSGTVDLHPLLETLHMLQPYSLRTCLGKKTYYQLEHVSWVFEIVNEVLFWFWFFLAIGLWLQLSTENLPAKSWKVAQSQSVPDGNMKGKNRSVSEGNIISEGNIKEKDSNNPTRFCQENVFPKSWLLRPVPNGNMKGKNGSVSDGNLKKKNPNSPTRFCQENMFPKTCLLKSNMH